MPLAADIADSLTSVRRRIDTAAHRARRAPSDITLVAVSKTFSAEHVRLAAAAGQTVFGENRVQEGADKAQQLLGLGLEWHLIGHLQSNKAKRAVASFSWIESVDSLELLQKLDRAATEQRVRPRILIQVDLAHEATKHGADEARVAELVDAGLTAASLDLVGLMTVPPIPAQPEDSRPWFRQLRELRDRLVSKGMPAERLGHLSMGMSHDFEVAIEEGATIVRVGSSIFGGRPAHAPIA